MTVMTRKAVTYCTRESARCSNARDYRAVLRECCRNHLREMSRNVADAFTQAGVTFWLDYGTLLGAVRNPITTWEDYPWLPAGEPMKAGILPHDKDADWGVLLEHLPKTTRALRGLVRRNGYQLIERRANAVVSSIKVRLSATNHTNLDLFFWRLNRAGQYERGRYIEVDDYKGREFAPERLLPLSMIEWEGMMMPAPRDPEAFCAFRYGPKWRTPIAANHDGQRR